MDKKDKTLLLLLLAVVVLIAVCKGQPKLFKHKVKTTLEKHLTPRQLLGKKLFFDESLSNPPGESCATCHDPLRGFEDTKELSESAGAVKGRFGNRNAPTAAYAAFSPYFHYDSKEQQYAGGQFWDGRAPNLMRQAQGPLLNPLEMNNPDKKTVIEKIKKAGYKDLFESVYGPGSLDDVETAYDFTGDAIATYEGSADLNPLSSKYDLYLEGKIALSDEEMRGLALFEDEKKGNCAACHPSKPDAEGSPPLFTDFTYDNLGVPRNPDNPFYKLPKEFNPDGDKYVDLGLGPIVKDPNQNGRFKVPTLRNVTRTAPYMHNGVFKTLKEVVDFYNTRDTKTWSSPEVPDTVNKKELGHLGLTAQEVDDIIAFLNTLTDGHGSVSPKKQ
jgi:cytochrome c peroxidase